MQETIKFLIEFPCISCLSGKEFQPDGIKLTDKVTNYYKEKYNYTVYNKILGIIRIDKEGVKDSLAHGMSSKKAAAYKAVGDVLMQGRIINQCDNWKNRGYATFVLVAPVDIANERHVCEVVVKKRTNKQSFYLHEVEEIKKLVDLFKTPTEGSKPTSSKLIISHLIDNFNIVF